MIPITGPVRMTVRQAAAEERIQWKNEWNVPTEVLTENCTLLLAYRENTLCGGIAWERTETACEIRWLYTEPESRGLGAAYLLTEQAVSAADAVPVLVWIPLENCVVVNDKLHFTQKIKTSAKVQPIRNERPKVTNVELVAARSKEG